MRTLIILSFLILSAFQINAQENKSSYSFEVCNENCVYDFPVYFENDAKYTVEVISPKGKLQTTLLYKKEVAAQTNKLLTLNIKRWKPGTYVLKITDGRGYNKFKKIYINRKAEKRS